jgi:hypothetical protein
MANISFVDLENKKSNPNKTNKDYKVSYFSIKDDGGDATVRFAHSSVKEIESLLQTVHIVKTLNKEGKEVFKRIACLRQPGEPASKCPLCSSENKAFSKVVGKFYVKLIEYVDENGKKVPKARIWERPASYAMKLKSLMDDYGDLTDIVFKIKRRGVRGSTETEYDEIYGKPEIYKPDIYVKDFSGFDGFKVEGSFYQVKTAEEMNIFLTTGEFPKTNSPIEKNTSYTKPVTPTFSETPKVTQTQPSEQPKPSSGQPNPIEGRPQRYKF